MRIIGGLQKGKQLFAPRNLPVRPTTDFAKEGLFNVLNNRLDYDELVVLDLFSGTGNITFEFASRQAKSVNSVDKHSPCINFIRETAKQLNFKNVFTERADAFKYLEKCRSTFDLIFADPPYELPNVSIVYDLIFAGNLLNPQGILIIEHGPRTSFADKPHYLETKKYGNVNFSFFQIKEAVV